MNLKSFLADCCLYSFLVYGYYNSNFNPAFSNTYENIYIIEVKNQLLVFK